MENANFYDLARKKKWEQHRETDERDRFITEGSERDLTSEEYALIITLMRKYKEQGIEFKKEYIKPLLDYNELLNERKETFARMTANAKSKENDRNIKE